MKLFFKNLGEYLKGHIAVTVAICCAVVLTVASAVFILPKIGAKKPSAVSKPAAVSSSANSSKKVENTSSEPEKEPEPELKIDSPAKSAVTVTSSVISFSGSSDPKAELKLNGETVERDSAGNFAFEKTLNIGKNTFTFNHKGKDTVYTVTYKYIIIKDLYPAAKQTLDSGSTFGVTVCARVGSTVTASFNGSTIKLLPAQTADVSGAATEFINYSGSFTLPTGNESNINLGKVTFRAALGGASDTHYSGNIVCKKQELPPGANYIAEVVAYSAETFDGNTADDRSNPTFNYLPQGTVDYCDNSTVYDSSSKNTYYKLRFGRRVYTDKKNPPASGRTTVTKRYVGTLPDHNEITVNSLANDGRHTVLTLASSYKAPFIFELKNQGYTNPSKQDFTISSATYTYIDIKFCYATVFNGTVVIPEDDPLFKSAEIINNGDSHTLRLHLKAQGKFYGWDCKYNQNGDLVFSFLNPVKITGTDSNSLSGVKVLIDVGHGGSDIGAPGLNKSAHPEAERNLNLALKLKAKLEAQGATVVMTRYQNSTVTADDRCKMLKEQQPDICIAVHHDSSESKSANGYSTFYSTPFSASAARFIDNQVKSAGIYNKVWPLRWHYFFTARITTCPVVLTENGFISSYSDFPGIADEGTNERKAEAITRGVIDYFKSIQ